MHKITPFLLVTLLLFSILTNFTLVGAQLTPARDLTGTWVGTAQYVNSFDYYPNPVTCSVTSDIVLIWTQSGNSFSGSIDFPNKKFAPGSDPLCMTVGHAPGPEMGGTISSTSFSGIIYEGVNLKGTFTTDLISGTIQGSNGAQKWDLSFKAVKQSAPTTTPTPTPQQTPQQQNTVTGNLKLDSSKYIVYVGHTTPVKISGNVNDGRGDRVTLTMTKPDASYEQVQTFLTNKGDFTSLIMLDQNSQLGNYKIVGDYYGTVFGSVSFVVSTPTSNTIASPTTPSPEYRLYKNDQYGFSIEYPTTWYHEDLAATGSNLSPVAYFAPDSQTTNAWLSVNYQKDSTAFRGLSDQQIVNALISTMKQNCQRYSVQSNGFTCSNTQFKTNVEKYRSLPAYEVSSTWTKTLSDGSTLDMVSIWAVIPVQNDLYAIVVRLSSQATAVYQGEVSHMLSSFNIYGVPEETVTPKNDYSNFGLQKGESISYKYSMSIQASDMETQQTVTNIMLQSLAKQIGNVTLNSIDDVQWIKYTVTNVSSTNILFNEETKVRNLEIFQNQRDMKYLQGTAIPITAKIGDSFDIFSSGAGGMLQGTVNKMTTITLGNTDIPVFELSGSTRNVSQDGATVTTLNATAHYDKKTGLMLDGLVDMNVIGAKYLKMHYEVKTIDWSELGKSSVQSGQTPAAAIPGWIKNTAKWWSQGSLTDDDFTKGIQYLISKKIIQVTSTQTRSKTSHAIPAFVKNTAKWWSEGQVSDSDFIKSVQYLVENGVISTTVKPKTLDSTSQALDTNGGTVSLSGGTNASFPPGALESGKTVSLTLLSSLPQQPPSSVIVGVGQALVISFGPTSASYLNLGIAPFASAQKEPSDAIKVTLNAGDLKSFPEINGSLGIADVVDLQGKDHFVGIPEDCNQSYTACTFTLQPSIVSVAEKVILSQVNLNTQVTGDVAQKLGPRIWNKQGFVDFPQGFDPTRRTLVITHGMASNVEAAYGKCINDIMAEGNYEQVIGFNYDFSKSIKISGDQFADFLDTLMENKLTQIDLEAHSEGTVVSLTAASKTSMKINNMILEGGPIDGTPISTAWFTTRLAQSGLWLPMVGYGLRDMYQNSHVLEELSEGNSFLKDIKDSAVSKHSDTNFIKVVGTKPYFGETALLEKLGDPFNGRPNDGIIPASSAMGKGLPGPTALSYDLTHTSLTCDFNTVKGVGAAVRQHPLPPSTVSSSATTGTQTGTQTGTSQGSSGTQGQSVRGCGGYRTCEDYCQYEIGSSYHYDSSMNACVISAGPSVSSGGVSGGTSGGTSSGTGGGQTSSGTISSARDLTGNWGGSFTLINTAFGTATFHSTFSMTLTQSGNSITGTVTYDPANSVEKIDNGNPKGYFSGRTFDIRGTVSSSSFTASSTDGSITTSGSFTTDLIRGTFTECSEGSCSSGSFQGNRR